ncbi:ATP-binding protein [Deinococcus maricopensis]|uniref:ATP-binding protein n=1 Tax=Deinococcus maricopensis (strain DSM 21211 / LMG 22137 / NRRL B-23946 / LB-34) TaxID=709986 RepID=E8U845_DEIML|nr:ATP-binding protein [Deinococcus maricopensis]ADV67234.1 hypothetical protein Deima_1585 [Deinococcus maricopensis DSM 21211]
MSAPLNDVSPIGRVLGTEEATPLNFWFSVRHGASVQLDDLVVARTTKPDGGEVAFYGVVDQVRKRHEGVTFESDVEDVVAGVLPASVAYAARVLVTRVDPEDFIPPQPGDAVRHARGEDLRRALSQDQMDRSFPAGVTRAGEVVPLNYEFVNGARGGHINISGISGVATKTSYALFLLYSIFNSGAVGPERANAKAVIFNVKGEDLFFLDKPNARLNEIEGRVTRSRGLSDRYTIMGLPRAPFTDVQFMAPPRPGTGTTIVPNVEQRSMGVTPYLWTVRAFCTGRMLPYAFVGKDVSANVEFLISNVTERLARLAEATPDGAAGVRVPDWDRSAGEDLRAGGPVPDTASWGAVGVTSLMSFEDLIDYLQYKLSEQNDGAGDPKWLSNQNQGTVQAFLRRLRGVQKHLSPLVRGDVSPQQAARYKPDVLRADAQVSVVDIHQLGALAQMFVVGVLLKELFEHKERVGRQNTVFVVLDELNKYAPRDGESPIKDVLLDIAERGRSLGIILIGAQQTASEVERRIVSNAAVRVVGRLDLAEAERPEYRFLPQSYRVRAGILQPGTMLVMQPDVPSPVTVTFPFPAWATRRDEVQAATERDDVEAEATDWLGL